MKMQNNPAGHDNSRQQYEWPSEHPRPERGLWSGDGGDGVCIPCLCHEGDQNNHPEILDFLSPARAGANLSA